MQADATTVFLAVIPTLYWGVIQGETTIRQDGSFRLDLPPVALIDWQHYQGYFGSVDHQNDLQDACRDDPARAFMLLGFGAETIVDSQGGLIADRPAFDEFTASCRADPHRCGFIVRSRGVPPVAVGEEAYLWFPSLANGVDILDGPAFSRPFSLVQLRYAPRDVVFRSTCTRSGFDVDLRTGWNTIVLEWDTSRFLVRSAHPTARHVWQFVAFPGAVF